MLSHEFNTTVCLNGDVERPLLLLPRTMGGIMFTAVINASRAPRAPWAALA